MKSLEAWKGLKGALRDFVKEVRDRLRDASEALERAKGVASSALDDARDGVAPAMGAGPLAELEWSAQQVEDALSDAQDAVKAAEDALYPDEDLGLDEPESEALADEGGD
jgi:hypothetical protein